MDVNTMDEVVKEMNRVFKEAIEKGKGA
jgi:hypothetical protein